MLKSTARNQEKPLPKVSLVEYVMPFLVFSFVILSAVFVVKPKVEALLSTRKQIKANQEKLVKISEKVVFLKKYSQADLQSKVNQLLKVLPSEKDVSSLVFTLKNLAEESGLEIASLSLNPGELATESAEVKKKLSENLMEITMTIAGNEEKIYEYLDKIETTAPITKVVTYSGKVEQDISESKIGLETYFLPIPKTLGKAEELVVITKEEEEVREKVSKLKILETIYSFPVFDSGKENPFSL